MKYFIFNVFLLAPVIVSAQEEIQLKPYLAAISVHNIDSSIHWYNKHLSFNIVSVKEYPDHGMKIGFVERDGFRFELVELKNSVAPSSLIRDFDNPAKIQGVGKLTFIVSNIGELFTRLKNQNVKILFDLRQDKEGRQSWFMVSDCDGNWLQFIEKWDK